MKKIKDVVDTALESDSFKTLCKAVIAAGLADALKGAGPFTIFAPTDDAFAKLPKGTVEGLLKDKKKLTSILKYHVVPEKLMVTDFKRPKSFKTMQGQEIKVDGLMWHINKNIKVNDAKTVKTDIKATNGVIHAIDSVLMPK
ncbi:MAG: fasciclin domain-containing protein [Candidatus Bathyarchaeota archaeon]|nr:fasciclin domain-containing protein [Candidatus Bathyarchaeota archaeon]